MRSLHCRPNPFEGGVLTSAANCSLPKALADLQPLSLGLWLAQGMAGWMRCWTEAVEGVPCAAGMAAPLPYPTTSLWQPQLTLLLAQITLQRLYPALIP
jgi:hypothetical protein